MSDTSESRCSSGVNTPTSRTRIDAMNREELIHRCKTLLNIAQKAKLSKDEAVREAAVFRQKLISCDEAVQSQLAELIGERDRAVTQVMSLTEQLNQQRDAMKRMSDGCRQPEEELTSLKTAVSSCEDQRTQLEQESDQLLVKLDAAEKSCQACEQRLEEAEKSRQNCERRLEKSQKFRQACEGQLVESEKSRHACEVKLEQAAKSRQAGEMKVEESEESHQMYGGRLDESDQSRLACEGRLEKCEKSRLVCEVRLEEAEKSRQACERRLEEAEEARQACAVRLGEAEQFRQACEVRLDDSDKSRQACELRLEKSEKSLQACEARLEESEKSRQACEVRLDASVRSAAQDLASWKEMAETFKTRWQEAVDALNRKETEMMVWKKTLSAAGDKNCDNGESVNTCDVAVQWGDDKPVDGHVTEQLADDVRCRDALAQLEQERQRCVDLEARVGELVSSQRDAESQLAQLQTELEGNKQLLKTSQARELELQKVLDNLKESCDSLSTDNNRAVATLDEVTSDMERLKIHNNDIEDKYSRKEEAILQELRWYEKNIVGAVDESVLTGSAPCNDDQIEANCLDLDYDVMSLRKKVWSVFEFHRNEVVKQTGEIAALESRLSETEHALISLQRDKDAVKERNSEMLEEMNQMNQALKDRGENVSSLENDLATAQRELKSFKSQVESLEKDKLAMQEALEAYEAAEAGSRELLKQLQTEKEQTANRISELSDMVDYLKSQLEVHERQHCLETISALQQEKRWLEDRLQENVQTSSDEAAVYEKTVADFMKIKSEFTDKEMSYEKRLSDSQTELDNLQTVNKSLKEEMNGLLFTESNLKRDLESVQGQLSTCQCELERYKDEVESLQQQLEAHNKQTVNPDGCSTNSSVQESGEQPQLSRAVPLDTQRATDLENQLQSALVANADLQRETADIRAAFKELDQKLVAAVEENRRMETLHAEKIGQLSDHSAAESTRVADQLQQSIDECCRLKEQLEQLQQERLAADRRLQELEAERDALLKRLEEAASQQVPDQMETQSEAMSTSTALSRAEDHSRMRDVEDSIEERYHKLRSLAVKLKKKLSVVSQQASSEQQLRQTAQTELGSVTAQLTAAKHELAALALQTRNVQALQADHDRLQDEMDVLRSSEKKSSGELSRAVQQVSELNLKLADITETRDTALANLASVSGRLTECEARAEAAELERQRLEVRHREAESRAEKERQERQQLQQQLDQWETERRDESLCQQQLAELQHSWQLADAQLQEARQQLVTSRSRLELAEAARDAADRELKLAADELTAEKQRVLKLKASVKESFGVRDGLEVRVRDLESENSQLISSLETLKQELEAVNLSLSDSARRSGDLTQTQDSLKRQVQSLQNRVESLQSSLDASQQELEINKRDFHQYKIRAQAVLKKAKENYASRREDEEAEYARMRNEETIENLRLELDKLRQEYGVLVAERDCLSADVERISESQRKAAEHAAQADVVWKQKCDKLRQQNEDEVGRHRQETESLKNQLAEITSNQQEMISSETAQLQDEVVRLTSELTDLQQQLASCGAKQLLPSRLHSSPLDVASMEREAAEGSESRTPRITPIPSSSIISLDKLLNERLDDSSSVVSRNTEVSSLDATVSLQRDVDKQRIQLNHLSALLNESETNNFRLTQMCDTLKEEIRRSERCEQRQKHFSQLEYLKNVMFKFLILNEGDERKRLVPVLSTMLTLSPSEVTALNTVADSVGSGGTDSRGWAGYLHLWSGGSQ